MQTRTTSSESSSDVEPCSQTLLQDYPNPPAPVRSAINNFNNLSPHLKRRLYSDFPSPVPSSQMKDHPIPHTCDPVWQLLLWNSTRLTSFDVSGQGSKLSSWISSSKPPTLEYQLTPPPHSLQETPISLSSSYQESYDSLWQVQPTRVARVTLQRRKN